MSTPTFKKSTRKDKKYMVLYDNKWIHFGDINYSQFHDSALGLYKNMDHNDNKRRIQYKQRASKIKDKSGRLTYLDKSSPNYWAYHYLW